MLRGAPVLAWGCSGAGLGVLWCWLGLCGGIATIGAALRRVAGVSGVYGRKTPRVLARNGQHRVPFRWLCWSCSACLRVFVVVVWLVFVGGLGGIATIGAALRRVAGVSGVYGRKTPRVLARNGQHRVPFRWLCWSCSACLRVFVVVVWLVFVGGLGGIATIGAALRRVAGVSVVYGRKIPRVVAQSAVDLGDMGCLGCSGLRFGRAGSWRGVFCAAACWVRRASVRAAGMIEPTVGVFCGAAREGGASWCVLTDFCAAEGEVLPRMVRFFCGGIG